ncbi:nucleotidyltransferase family protein [Epibacterium ulvae]|uniref:nucleotidyltransferase family protein n=1 Tax=Epibacterium ulvae TaxID=1156985 RepID=UPI002492C8A0|nr:nucleotidyltransferase family protein [Epibacterium ulvae]
MTDHTPKSVMLFAAGFGTRMRPVTLEMPKPMVPVAGRPLIDHALDLIDQFGADTIVANTHYLPAPLHQHLEPKGVEISHEASEILDTGGGLRNALPSLGPNPVFTVNPDVIWKGENPLSCAAKAWDPSQMDALLVCVPIKRCVGRRGTGDFSVTNTGALIRGGNLVYGGVQILKTDLLKDIPETSFSLNVVWDMMAQENRLYSVEYPGFWCDVGTPEGITQAEDLMAKNV